MSLRPFGSSGGRGAGTALRAAPVVVTPAGLGALTPLVLSAPRRGVWLENDRTGYGTDMRRNRRGGSRCAMGSGGLKRRGNGRFADGVAGSHRRTGAARRPRAVIDGVTIWARLAMPIRIGPTSSPWAFILRMLRTPEAASELAKISTLAAPSNRASGRWRARSAGSSALSTCISPS